MKEIEKLFDNINRFELFTGSLSYKNISFYKRLGYKICKYEKISDILELVYLEKINNSQSLDAGNIRKNNIPGLQCFIACKKHKPVDIRSFAECSSVIEFAIIG